MDADPGQQWILWVIAGVMLVLSFWFALYEQALGTTSAQALENASADLTAKRREKFVNLGQKLPREYELAHFARWTTSLLGLIFGAAAGLLRLDQSLAVISGGAVVLGLIVSLLVEPFLVKLPLRLVSGHATKKVVKSYGYQHFAVVLFLPVAFLSNWLSQLFGKNDATPVAPNQAMSWQNIVDLIEEGRSKGEIDNDEYEMIEGILSLHEKMAREVMVPRIDAFMIDITNDNDRSIDDILQMNYSRIPVYHEDKDKVIGVVHIKNLIKAARKFGFEHITIRQVMNEPFFVPETIMIDQLIYEMKRKQNHMAILLDEYGGVVGLVTLEDLIEEIVGEIEDESDEPDRMLRQVGPTKFSVQGKMALADFNDEFGQTISVPDVDTIAGYMITQLGYIPDEPGVDQITLDDGSKLKVSEMDGDRLLKLEIDVAQTALEYRVQREKSKRKAQAKLELHRDQE